MSTMRTRLFRLVPLLACAPFWAAEPPPPGAVRIDALLVELPVGVNLPPDPAHWGQLPGLAVLGEPEIHCLLGKEAVLDTLAPSPKVKPTGLGSALETRVGYRLELVPDRLGDRIAYRGVAEASRLRKMVTEENPGLIELDKRELHFSGDAALETPFWLVTPATDPDRRMHVRLTFRALPVPPPTPAPTPTPAP
jgi:hypothetical protein